MPLSKKSLPCHCQSGLSFRQCCQPLLENTDVAKTPEQLMRSRYSAFKLGNKDYLVKTWHPNYRPENIDLGTDIQWIALQIVDKQQSQELQGMVHFRAFFKTGDKVDVLEEISQFSKIADEWKYVNGEIIQSKLKISRNTLCPCGSGKKFKRCCS